MTTIQPSQVRRIDDANVIMPCAECGEDFQTARSSTVTICRKCRTSTKSVGDVMKSISKHGDILKTCSVCGGGYGVPGFYGVVAKFSDKCPPCMEKQISEETAHDLARCYETDQTDKRKKYFAKIYPFTTWTVIDLLPNQATLTKILTWDYARKRGLFLHGPSRLGKSRCIWQLAEREVLAGRSLKVIDSGFGYDYAAMYSENASKAKEWMDALIAADILLADDIFKIKATDSAEQAIFYVVDKRLEQDKPIWWTTNDSAASLAARLGSDRGPALMERIKETCDAIAFISKPK